MIAVARILATVFALIVLSRSIVDYKNKKESLQMTVFWIIVWLTISTIAFFLLWLTARLGCLAVIELAWARFLAWALFSSCLSLIVYMLKPTGLKKTLTKSPGWFPCMISEKK